MTVTQVLGCGMQKGAAEYYRGIPVDMMLLPKVQVEIVVAKVPVEEVVKTARKVLYTDILEMERYLSTMYGML